MSADAIAPVLQRVQVALPAAEAFALFTDGITRWWPLASHSCGGDDALEVRFEPRVGGAVVERTRDGSRHRWGTLTAWQPPHHFAMTWHPGRDAAEATRLDVRFVAAADGRCEVQLRHDGWDSQARRGDYDGGWVTVLARFVATATTAEAR